MSNNNVLENIDELSKVVEDISTNLHTFKKIVKLVELTDQISTLERERFLLCKDFSPSDYLALAKIIKDNKE